MKTYNPIHKLLSGIALHVVFWLFTYNVDEMDVIRVERYLRDDFFSCLYHSLAVVLTSGIEIIVYVIVLTCFSKGAYRICLFFIYLDVFSD